MLRAALLVSLLTVAFTGPCLAQAEVSMELPPPRPAEADAASAMAPIVLTPVPRPADGASSSTVGTVEPPPGLDASNLPVALKAPQMVPAAAQRETVQRINDYLNAIHVMSGTFTQIGPDGAQTTGRFYISKPGKLRFQYDSPSTIELVADGRSVAVRDRKLNTQDLYLIGQTPLRFLLQDQLDLLADSNVVGVTVEPEVVSVTMKEDQAIGGSAQIVLIFSGTDYSLKQWSITDAQGYQTSVAVFNINTVDVPDNKLFTINEQRILN